MAQGELQVEQALWLLYHTLDCCERQVASSDQIEFLLAHYPDTSRVAYVHQGHAPVRWRKWSQWRRDAYPEACLRRVPARQERVPLPETPDGQ